MVGIVAANAIHTMDRKTLIRALNRKGNGRNNWQGLHV
jgi:hypothetical protein